ncbi:MAG: phage antirepressor KilAC domain-containing protein [Prevotella sp.]|nr:phage antirepressor KilAC domain-containing protein [Prevotella sp.]
MPKDFLKTKETKSFLKALSNRKKILIDDLVQVRAGAPETGGGTWMHEDVAIEFARWLSPDFAIWTNDRIKELLREGVATVSDDDDTIANAMAILQRRLEEKDRRLQEKEQRLQLASTTIEQQGQRIVEQRNEIATLTPMADYTREVLQSTSTFTLTQMAKDLGLRSVMVLTEFCRNNRILYRQSGQWMPTAQYSGRGFFETRTAKYVKSDNTIGTSLSTVVTEKGRLFLRKFMEQKTRQAAAQEGGVA